MFVVVYSPSTNDVYLSRRLAPREKLCARRFAEKVAADWDADVDDSDGYIPSCCGDIRVEFRPHRDNDICIWSGESFYLKH